MLKPWLRRAATWSLIAPAFAVFLVDARAQSAPDLTTMPLEQLMGVEVTSPGKRPQRLGDAASAVFVLNQDDIRRSGATTIPELLRLVPGIQVAQITQDQWAITARGFDSRFANKLLVLQDGRTLYSPLFSGVFWDRQDTLLEDIDRIEVIRGPGATLYGVNAVNGVINIITKHSQDTQGGLAEAAVGTTMHGETALRYGGKIDDTTTYRAYGKYFENGGSRSFSGGDGGDNWQYGRVGFRADGAPNATDKWTLDGGAYYGSFGETFLAPSLTAPFSVATPTTDHPAGGHILGRWDRALSGTSDLGVQVYYDRSQFTDPRLSETRDTFDLAVDHHIRVGDRHEVVWGGGYRASSDSLRNSSIITFSPTTRVQQLVNTFGQDTITLVEDRLFFTAGTKLEYNSYTSLEVQPSARLLWTPTPSESVWTAVSRANRTPSRAEENVSLLQQVVPPGTASNPTAFPAQIRINGNPDLGSEDLVAYEAGYRMQLSSSASFDIAGFYNDYSNLVAFRPGTTTLSTIPVPSLITPFNVVNGIHGETHGIELLGNWRALNWWRLQGSYTFLEMHLHGDPQGRNGESPRHLFGLRSLMDVTDNVTFDIFARRVDNLPTLGIPPYFELNARIGWRVTPQTEVSLTGENLIHANHPEFGSETLPTVPTEVPRAAIAKIVTRF